MGNIEMKSVKVLAAGFIVAFLNACGGGGGSPGSINVIIADPGAAVETSAVASFDYQIDKNALTNSGSDKALLKVTALNERNNPVSGAVVSVSVDTGIYTPLTNVTGVDGVASGEVTIGGSKTNRDINVKILINGLEKTFKIPVTGSQLILTPLPASPSVGQSMTLTVKVSDVNGNPIAGIPVNLSGSLGFTQSPVTSSSGNAVALLGAVPASPGIYFVDVSASGIVERKEVVVSDGSGGGIPDALSEVSAASLSVVPNTISPNPLGSSANRAQLRALFLDASSRAIQNVRVKFIISKPGSGNGESISTGTATVYSDVNGVAISEYIAGDVSSSTGGVEIKACFGESDLDVADGACVNSKTASLTVASQPVSITLGDNTELSKGGNNLTYIKKFDIAVSDSAGRAVAGAQISASVDLVRYSKGEYDGLRFTCLNEDVNRNSVVDAEDRDGIDDDGNDVLLPRKADVLVSFLGSSTTGTNGRATIQVEYPQNVATWLSYVVKVTTGVTGSEGMVQKTYLTSFIEGDQTNGSFLDAPYGVNNCTTPD